MSSAKDKDIIQYIDHTTLSQNDTPQSVAQFTQKAMELYSRGLPRVASVCVFPSMIESVGLTLGETQIAITAVCGGFPAAQTYIEVKMLEVAMAIENGADEIDIVINIGATLLGDYNLVSGELEAIVNEINGDAILKVILETGVLQKPSLIKDASLLAMRAGADFIKTSTGKTEIGATRQSVEIMCDAISQFHKESGRKVGLKISGGISNAEEAMKYLKIVQERLGEEWLTPKLLRFGSSSLLSSIID